MSNKNDNKLDIKQYIQGLYEKYGTIDINCEGSDALPIDSILPFQGDLKKTPVENLKKLIRSIFIHGFVAPYFVWDGQGDWKLLDGHSRLLAIIAIREAGVPIPGLFPVTVIIADSEKKARAILLAITSQYGVFQKEVLDDWVSELDIEIAESLRIVDEEMELAITSLVEPEETDGDDEVPKEVPPITKLGDLWELSSVEGGNIHRLMCGDSTDREQVEKLIEDNHINCVFSDPPYGVDIVQNNTVGGAAPTKFGTDGADNIVEAKKYEKIIGDETTDTAKNFYNLCLDLNLKNIVLWGGNYYTDFVPPSRCWLIWDKEMTGNFSEAEMAWTSFSKGGIKVFKFLWNGLSREGNRIDELDSRVHPTQKPVGLFVNIFERFDGFKSYFDGFGGSGSTLIAGEKLGRIIFLCELSGKYCDVIISRFKTWCEKNGKTPIIKLNGEIFDFQKKLETDMK